MAGRGLRGCRGLEQLKIRELERAGFNGRRPPRRTPYNGTFVQRTVNTGMQAVEGVPARFVIFHSERRNKVAPSGGSLG